MTEITSDQQYQFLELESAPGQPDSLGRKLSRFEVGLDDEATARADYEFIARQFGGRALGDYEIISPPEHDPYKDMADAIKRIIIGQDAAVDKITEALSKQEFRNPKLPVASFMFMGPTGVGKTELSNVLSDYLHKDDKIDLLRIDCADYSAGHTVARLTGSPPGYVGRDQVPALSPAKVEGKNRVIVFDEIEKGAPELHTLLLSILEEGSLSLNNGNQSSFRDAIVIMTSNVGAREMQARLKDSRMGFSLGSSGVKVNQGDLEKTVSDEAKRIFRPELLNRIDHKVVFHSLNDEQLVEVLDSHLTRLNDLLLEKGIVLDVAPKLQQAIVESCQDRREYGGRNIVRTFDNIVLSRLAKYVNVGSIKRGSRVLAYFDEAGDVEAGDVPFGFASTYDDKATAVWDKLQAKIREAEDKKNKAAEMKRIAEERARQMKEQDEARKKIPLEDLYDI